MKLFRLLCKNGVEYIVPAPSLLEALRKAECTWITDPIKKEFYLSDLTLAEEVNDRIDRLCVACGVQSMQSIRPTIEHFSYGVDAVQLSAMVMVTKCKKCGYSWTGEQAEKSRLDAVWAYERENLEERQLYERLKQKFEPTQRRRRYPHP